MKQAQQRSDRHCRLPYAGTPPPHHTHTRAFSCRPHLGVARVVGPCQQHVPRRGKTRKVVDVSVGVVVAVQPLGQPDDGLCVQGRQERATVAREGRAGRSQRSREQA